MPSDCHHFHLIYSWFLKKWAFNKEDFLKKYCDEKLIDEYHSNSNNEEFDGAHFIWTHLIFPEDEFYYDRFSWGSPISYNYHSEEYCKININPYLDKDFTEFVNNLVKKPEVSDLEEIVNSQQELIDQQENQIAKLKKMLEDLRR